MIIQDLITEINNRISTAQPSQLAKGKKLQLLSITDMAHLRNKCSSQVISSNSNNRSRTVEESVACSKICSALNLQLSQRVDSNQTTLALQVEHGR